MTLSQTGKPWKVSAIVAQDLCEEKSKTFLKRKRISITVEAERVMFVNRSGKVPAWCGACGAETWMIAMDEAAILSRVSSRTIYRWVEMGSLHSVETPEGLLLVCLNSLSSEDASTQGRDSERG